MASDKKFEIILDNVRLSYTYIFTPYEGDNGKSYCTHAILAADHPQIPEVKRIQRLVAEAKWKNEAEAILLQIAAKDRLCLHEGNVGKPGVDAYKNKIYISSGRRLSDGPPKIVATVNGVNMEVSQDHKLAPYSGCRARVMINLWAQDNKYGKRINAGLMGVQFLSHDERLSGTGRTASADEFGLAAGAADEAAPSSAGGAASGLI